MKSFNELFKEIKPIIGVIHLKGDSENDIKERALKEIEIYKKGGVDGIIVEDYFGSYPYLEWTLDYLSKNNPGIPWGVNCLNFDSLNFRLARIYHCDFLQIDSVVGHVKPRDEYSLDTFFKLERSDCEALLMGGVRFKYMPVLSACSLEEDLQKAERRCDVVCVTGDGTGMQTPLDKIKEFKKYLGEFPFIICSGLNEENAYEQLKIADGAVVGSFFKDTGKDTGDVSLEKVERLMTVVKKLRNDIKSER